MQREVSVLGLDGDGLEVRPCLPVLDPPGRLAQTSARGLTEESRQSPSLVSHECSHQELSLRSAAKSHFQIGDQVKAEMIYFHHPNKCILSTAD